MPACNFEWDARRSMSAYEGSLGVGRLALFAAERRKAAEEQLPPRGKTYFVLGEYMSTVPAADCVIWNRRVSNTVAKPTVTPPQLAPKPFHFEAGLHTVPVIHAERSA